MSRPLTWQNVSGPDFTGAAKMMDSAFESFNTGMGGYRERGIENAEQDRLDASHAAKMLMSGANLKAQQFQNANAGRVLDSEISARSAHADAARFNSGTSPAFAASRALLGEHIKKNEDGSIIFDREGYGLDAQKRKLDLGVSEKVAKNFEDNVGITGANAEALRRREVKDAQATKKMGNSKTGKKGLIDAAVQGLSGDWVGDDRDRERATSFLMAETSEYLTSAQMIQLWNDAKSTSLTGDTDENRGAYLEAKKNAELEVIKANMATGKK